MLVSSLISMVSLLILLASAFGIYFGAGVKILSTIRERYS